MNKVVLRKIFLEKRRFLSDEEYHYRNECLSRSLFQAVDFSAMPSVHVFLPIGKFKEANTWQIIAQLRATHPQIKIYVPKTDTQNLVLTHYLLESDEQIGVNKWGIPEPLWGQEASSLDFGTVLVPLVTFDKKGNRIGYGKGFYDRFLEQCSPQTQKIGLSLGTPLDAIDYTETHDVPLDGCVTPYGVYWFDKGVDQFSPVTAV